MDRTLTSAVVMQPATCLSIDTFKSRCEPRPKPETQDPRPKPQRPRPTPEFFGFRAWVSGFGFRVSGFRVSGFGVVRGRWPWECSPPRAPASKPAFGFRVWVSSLCDLDLIDACIQVSGSVFRICGFHISGTQFPYFWVSGSVFRVSGIRVSGL